MANWNSLHIFVHKILVVNKIIGQWNDWQNIIKFAYVNNLHSLVWELSDEVVVGVEEMIQKESLPPYHTQLHFSVDKFLEGTLAYRKGLQY